MQSTPTFPTLTYLFHVDFCRYPCQKLPQYKLYLLCCLLGVPEQPLGAELLQAGDGALEAGVVVDGDLVENEITARVCFQNRLLTYTV